MAGIIDSDYRRFREIVKGHVRKNLKQYIVNGELIGKEGKDYVRVPLPYINLPKFIYNDSENAGIGQGDGEEGDPIDGYGEEYGEEGGNQPGDIMYEADLSLEEIAEILGEKLELAELKPKSVDRILKEKDKYKSIRKTGPESLRHFKRTYQSALKRMISTGEYKPEKPIVIPVRQDKHYRSWVREPEPNAKALIIYGRDVSGSMDDERVDIVRNAIWCQDIWIRSQYKDRVHHAYLAHHSDAWEVDREKFFSIYNSSGGTVISSIFNKMIELFDGPLARYNKELWNIYIFYYGDGENYESDNDKCISILQEKIIPSVNLFCYGHVTNASTNFQKKVMTLSNQSPNTRYAEISTNIQILDALKKFLGAKK